MTALEQRLLLICGALTLWVAALLAILPGHAPQEQFTQVPEQTGVAEAPIDSMDEEPEIEQEPGFAQETFRTGETEKLILGLDDLQSYAALAGKGLSAPALSLFQYTAEDEEYSIYTEIRKYREEQLAKQVTEATLTNATPAAEAAPLEAADANQGPPLPEPEPGATPPAPEAQPSTRALFADGAEAFAAGDWQRAADVYEKVLQDIPDHPATLVNLGLVQDKLGLEEQAIESLEKAVKEVPDSVPANTVLGLIYSRNGKLTEATARLSLAVALAPQDPQTHNHLGVVFAQRSWRQAAESEFRTAIELNPLYAEAHFNLSLMYLERTPASVELARRHYMTAIDLGAAPDPQVESLLAAVRPLTQTELERREG